MQNAALVGAASTLPNWLAGCNCLPGVTPDEPEERESRTLHFDLSQVPVNGEFTLHIPRSSSDGAKLEFHTSETLVRSQDSNSLLNQIKGQQPTHFVEEVDLPAGDVQRVWITTPTVDGDAIVAMHIHIPERAFTNLVEKRRRAMMEGRSARIIDEQSHAKLNYLGIKKLRSAANAQTFAEMNAISTPMDAAATVIFHHPEIMSLNPDQAAHVVDVIETLQGTATSCTGENVGLLKALACNIASQGLPGANRGWMRLVPATGPDGEPVMGSDGRPIIDYQLSDATLEAAQPVVRQVLKQIFNDPDIKGNRAAEHPGITVVDGDFAPVASARGYEANGINSEFNVVLEHPAGDRGSNLYGLMFKDQQVLSVAQRTVAVDVQNLYLRFVSAYVQYLQADGVSPILENGSPVGAKELATIPTNDTVMGVPMLADWNLRRTRLKFDMPKEASYAQLQFGTLGLGGEAFDDMALKASIWTMVINIGVPTLLLGLGVGMSSSELMKDIWSDPVLMAEIVAIVIELLVLHGVYTGSCRAPLFDIAAIIIWVLLKAIPEFTAKVLGYASRKQMEQSVPFLGWAFKALSISGTLAQLAQTTSEVLSSPARFNNMVSVPMSTTVTIRHDPDNFAFPAVAKRFVVRATYDGKVSRQICRTLPGTTQSDPLSVTFANVPMGGTVHIDVWFLSDSNWIAGYAGTGDWSKVPGPDGVEQWEFTSKPVKNLPETASALDLQLKEMLVPIDPQTRYSHKQKLAYHAGTGQHYWVSAPAPTATAGNLDPGRSDRLHALNGITVSQTAGMAAYTWRSPGSDVCPGDAAAATSLNYLQNISLTQRPDDALKPPACGHGQVTAVAYSLLATLKAPNRNFYVDSVYGPYQLDRLTSLAYKHHVRAVKLDSMTDTTPWSASAGESWGFFTQCPDAIAVHPSGYVAAINTATSKMEILKLTSPKADDLVGAAVAHSGEGTMPGHMYQPVAIGVTPDGALLVLELGNNRVQAFDCFGNVNKVFRNAQGDATNLLDLQTPGVHYLDMAVERAAGYIYVLFHVGSGYEPMDYYLDIYSPHGEFICRTQGLNAARIALDNWRNIYSLNYESFNGANNRIEPSVSQWIPSTPPGTDPQAVMAAHECGY